MAIGPVPSGATFTTAELITEVKDAADIPDASDWTDLKILRFADRAIRGVLSHPETTNGELQGRRLTYVDVLLSDAISGSEFWIPNTAASGTLSFIDYHHSATSEAEPLNQIAPSQVYHLDYQRSGEPEYFFVRDGRVVVVPTPTNPNADSFIRIHFQRAHPKLVVASEVGVIDSLNTTSNLITLTDTHPATWPATYPYFVDLYSGYSPHEPLYSGLRVSSDSGAELVYVDPLNDRESDLEGYDTLQNSTKVAIHGTSDCIQLPESCRDAVVEWTVSLILKAKGDDASSNSHLNSARSSLQATQAQMTPRVKSRKAQMMTFDGPLSRRARGGRGNRWYPR